MGNSCFKDPIVINKNEKENNILSEKTKSNSTNVKTGEIFKYGIIEKCDKIEMKSPELNGTVNKLNPNRACSNNILQLNDNNANSNLDSNIAIGEKGSKSLTNARSSSYSDLILVNNTNDINRSVNGLNYFSIHKNLEFIKGECIGTGKLGSVYSGLNTNTGEIVAIKSINLNSDKSIRKQIFEINEAVEKLSQLKHKNIIKYICTQPSEKETELDIIFEFCNGGSIKQLLQKFGKFDEKLIKLYVKQILEGLVYLHDQDIVHRNINNSNVLVDGNGTVKLSDFVVSNILIGDNTESILFFNTKGGKGKYLIIF
jgi:hypothetical protein